MVMGTYFPDRIDLKCKVYKCRYDRKSAYTQNNIFIYIASNRFLFMVAVLVWMVSLSLCITALAGSTTNFSDNAMYAFLETGIVSYNADEMSGIVTTFMRLCQKVSGIVFPIMGIYALTMIGIHMAATVIYLMHPAFFNEVHALHVARKFKQHGGGGGGIGGMISGVREIVAEAGILGFIKSYLFDVKEMAFEEAISASGDDDYQPTMGDFFKYNFIKYVGIIAACMLIIDRTMVDFMFRGAEITASFVKRAAYNYDYVVMIDNILESGNDYTPPYNTKNVDEANLKKIFDKVYAILKTECKTQEQRSTTALQTMGQTLYTRLETEIRPKLGEQVNYKNFVVKSEKILIGTGNYQEDPSRFFIPLSAFGFQTTDVVAVYVSATEDSIVDIDYRVTNYKDCWKSATAGGIPTTFSYGAVDSSLQQVIDASGQTSKATSSIVGYASVRFIYSDGSSLSENRKVDTATATISLTAPQNAPANASLYAITIDSANVTYSNGNKLAMGLANWRNTSIILGEDSSKQPANTK